MLVMKSPSKHFSDFTAFPSLAKQKIDRDKNKDLMGALHFGFRQFNLLKNFDPFLIPSRLCSIFQLSRTRTMKEHAHKQEQNFMNVESTEAAWH